MSLLDLATAPRLRQQLEEREQKLKQRFQQCHERAAPTITSASASGEVV